MNRVVKFPKKAKYSFSEYNERFEYKNKRKQQRGKLRFNEGLED